MQPSPLALVRRPLVALLAILPLVVVPAAAAAQATVGGRFINALSSCGNPTPDPASGTPTSSAWSTGHSAGGCNVFGSAFSYLGVVGAMSQVSINTGDWSSGGMGVISSAGWSESVMPSWNGRFSIDGVSRLRLNFNVGATGGVSASAATGGPAGANAQIRYFFGFGGARFDGMQYVSDGGPTTVQGSWGTIAGSVDLGVAGTTAADYRFEAMPFSLFGEATAGVGKGYVPNAQATAQSVANFGSTLVWGGVTSVQAFDAAGNEIALPDDFQVDLSGRDSGYDYWNAAERAVTTTPEPATFALMGGGLLVLGLVRARRRTR